MLGHADKRFHCALCGFEFEHQNTACVKGCPLGSACNLTRCPSCGYEFPSESQTWSWLRGLFGRRALPAAAGEGTIGLFDLGEEESAEIVRLGGANPKRRNALAVYGVVPGSRIVLQQKRPACVIRVGETELALEDSIAREFLVRRA